jgi:ABC-type glycerol-3-phosphate transport system permease component
MVAAALKTQSQIINPNASLLPLPPRWGNIATAWDVAPFGTFFLNTAIFSVVTTVGQIATGMLAGYAFAMFDFPAKRVLFYLVLSGLMIPFTVVLVPVVQLLADVGWVNTYQGLIVPNLASAFGCFLYRQFFLSVPLELGEAARIDGASEWRIFLQIYRPLAQPMTAAFTIIAFLQNWNNFLFPLVVTSSEKLMMVSQGLTIFDGQISKVSYNLLMAGSLIAVIPVLAVALVAQRRVVEGLTLGAVR